MVKVLDGRQASLADKPLGYGVVGIATDGDRAVSRYLDKNATGYWAV